MYFTRLESSAFRGKAASYVYCLLILALMQIVRIPVNNPRE